MNRAALLCTIKKGIALVAQCASMERKGKVIDTTAETISINIDEMRKKNNALWMFVHIYLPFATGDLDRYLDIAMEAHRWSCGKIKSPFQEKPEKGADRESR